MSTSLPDFITIWPNKKHIFGAEESKDPVTISNPGLALD
jgi:hypothetical protein